ncbi:hypothetical protein [Roseateles sp. UC29_93]|jgi:hypothetical protein|uniref:hypothetical protein n=1 Tax=Roseateles TaxID=93681 RepID=UPI00366BC854
MTFNSNDYPFLRAIQEAKREVDSWPEWKQRSVRMRIWAPGVPSTVYLIDDRIYRDIPLWYREEQERGES